MPVSTEANATSQSSPIEKAAAPVRVRPAKKTLMTLAGAALLSLGFLSASSAAGASGPAAGAAVAVGPYPAHGFARTKTFGDCRLRVFLVTQLNVTGNLPNGQFTYFTNTYSHGGVRCARRHTVRETASVKLNNAKLGPRSGVAVSGPNGFATPELYSASVPVGMLTCQTVQALLEVNISGLGRSWVTSGTPQYVSCGFPTS